MKTCKPTTIKSLPLDGGGLEPAPYSDTGVRVKSLPLSAQASRPPSHIYNIPHFSHQVHDIIRH